MKNISGKFLTEMCKSICEPSGYFSTRNNGVARAFPGGQLAHPESQNEEENEKSLRKIKKKKLSKFEENGTLAHLGL